MSRKALTDAFIEGQNPHPLYYTTGDRQGFPMEIRFSKLYENGNDFIVIDEFEKTAIPDEMKGQFAAIYCDRRYGIGAEGVIYVMKSTTADLRMRLILPDESEAQMYGDGIRCLAKFAYDAGYVKKTCTVETLAGGIGVSLDYRDGDFLATIAMATPQFDRTAIPATGSGEYQEKIAGFEVNAVNIGVPHAVIIVDSVDAIDMETVAPAIRHHPSFPEGTNVNFVEKTGRDSIRIRTFERGVEGETLSCGTGATASAVIARRLGLTGDVVGVETRGGPLTLSLKDSVKMEGPATTVFAGTILF